MKLKDGLILREVAGQYVIVPTGKRVQEVTNIVYISSSAAYLWDYMKDHGNRRPVPGLGYALARILAIL